LFLEENLDGKLNLPRGSGGLADQAEARAFDGICRQTHINDIEDVKELGTELDIEEFTTAGAFSDGSVFDE
jgi:hypothetical protein